MRPFACSWYVYQVWRALGWVLIVFGVYGLVPGPRPYPFEFPDYATRAIFSVAVLAWGAAWVMASESWLVWFRVERNTADVVHELRRLRRVVERVNRRLDPRRDAPVPEGRHLGSR